MAIDIIKAAGVPEENIIFVNMIASTEGLRVVGERFPSLRIVTAAVDDHMTASK